MALKSTVFKAFLTVSDISQNHYCDYSLTVARHPSETDERLLFRLVAFALNAHEDLSFGSGISTHDEPDLWQKSLDGRIEKWIDLGQPDEKRLKQACSRAEQVKIYSYQPGAALSWWKGVENKVRNINKLEISILKVTGTTPLLSLIERSMKLSCTIQDNEILIASEASGEPVTVQLELENKKTLNYN